MEYNYCYTFVGGLLYNRTEVAIIQIDLCILRVSRLRYREVHICGLQGNAR